jgi:hypothetical protein
MRKINIEEFIEKSNIIHNHFYDYSLTIYNCNNKKIKIICPKHGTFEQLPLNHLMGKGCSQCVNNKKLTKEIFIERANIIHNYKYDYSLVDYNNFHSKVKIICPQHDMFEQLVSKHLLGSGCSKCGLISMVNKKKYSLEYFINRSNEFHNYKYDYSLVDLNNKKVKIICPEHGIFEQNYLRHFHAGCFKCGHIITSKKQSSNIDQFIEKANKIHNHKYDYSLSVYKTMKIKVKIICDKHGIFEQSPDSHINNKQGCPKCCSSISSLETKWLDSLGINIRNYYIIIDNQKIKFDGYDPETKTVYEFYGDYWHGNPNKFNHNDLNKKNKKTFGELYNDTMKREQLIKNAGYNLISIWEQDYEQI